MNVDQELPCPVASCDGTLRWDYTNEQPDDYGEGIGRAGYRGLDCPHTVVAQVYPQGGFTEADR